MLAVSVMIPTCVGGFSYLAKLIPALADEAEQSDAEIIVIDNASRDGTSNFLACGRFDLSIIVNKNNRGFAVAHNQAARKAEGEYLLLLNNDTQIIPGFIKEMQSVFDLDPKIAAVGCLIFMMDNKKVQHAGVCFTSDYVPYELGLEVPSIVPALPASDPRVRSVREVPSVTAACVMIKKSVFEEVGGFDERYRNGWEDQDLMLKIREKGYKIYYTGRTHIFHKKHGSVGRFTYEQDNRNLFDSLWVHTGKAKEIIGERREA